MSAAQSSKVLLVLGSGPNIGAHLAQRFSAAGYRVALTSRKAPTSNDTNALHIQADLAQPHTIPSIFEKVKAELGVPSVVVFNASGVHRNPANDPLALPLEDIDKDLDLNLRGFYIAAQQFASASANQAAGPPKTFIYTGNMLNSEKLVIPTLVSQGVGKAAAARVLHAAALAYKDRGLRFYYADERTAQGKAVYADINGAAAGEHYLHLAEAQGQEDWLQTFVKGQGYKNFA